MNYILSLEVKITQCLPLRLGRVFGRRRVVRQPPNRPIDNSIHRASAVSPDILFVLWHVLRRYHVTSICPPARPI